MWWSSPHLKQNHALGIPVTLCDFLMLVLLIARLFSVLPLSCGFYLFSQLRYFLFKLRGFISSEMAMSSIKIYWGFFSCVSPGWRSEMLWINLLSIFNNSKYGVKPNDISAWWWGYTTSAAGINRLSRINQGEPVFVVNFTIRPWHAAWEGMNSLPFGWLGSFGILTILRHFLFLLTLNTSAISASVHFWVSVYCGMDDQWNTNKPIPWLACHFCNPFQWRIRGTFTVCIYCLILCSTLMVSIRV